MSRYYCQECQDMIFDETDDFYVAHEKCSQINKLQADIETLKEALNNIKHSAQTYNGEEALGLFFDYELLLVIEEALSKVFGDEK